MFSKEGLHCPAGMVLGTIVNQDQRLCGGGQDLGQEGLVTRGRETASMPVVEQPAREEVNHHELHAAV